MTTRMTTNLTCLLATLTALVLIGCGGSETSSSPKVFWVSQPVNKDETMLITGGNLLPGTTRVDAAQLADGDPGDPSVQSPTVASWTSLAPLTSTTRSLTATIPANWSDGVYALRLSNGIATDSIRLVNAPDPWFVQGDKGDSATPGGSFYVAGATLERSGGATPQAVLLPEGGGAPVARLALAERITTSTGYALRFSVPASVPEGEYQLWLHNGRGGKAAWVKFSSFIEAPVSTVRVKTASPWPTDVFTISNYAGTADQRFAAAVAAATANGGGRIQVPAGTYSLTQPLMLPPYTVLVGAGQEATFLNWNVNPGASLVIGQSLTLAGSVRATFAIEDIQLSAAAPDFTKNVVERTATSEPGWLRRVTINAPVIDEKVWDKTATALFLRQTSNTLLEDVHIDAAKAVYARDNVSHVRLQGSTFNWNNLNIWFSGQSHNILVVGNMFQKRSPLLTQASFVLSVAHGSKPYNRDVLWAKNTVTQAPGDATLRTSGYTMDGGEGIYLGGVSSTSGTQMTLTGQTTTVNATGKPWAYSWEGSVAQILDGQGAGQWRYVTQAGPGERTIGIDRPWDIVPDAASTLAIVNMQGRVLMIDNDYQRDTQHDDYYLAVDSIKAGNNFGVEGAPLAAQTWTGKHYQGTFPAWHLQFLDNRIARGEQSQFGVIVYNDPVSDYVKVSGAAQVYRNNTNPAGGRFNLRFSSDLGGLADMLVERNEATNLVLSRYDGNLKRNEKSSYAGFLLRSNTQVTGAPSVIQTVEGSVPAGVTVVP